ncbi:MAG: hypothetical protein WCB67_05550 [Solirubrobacteraceae bacterium]
MTAPAVIVANRERGGPSRLLKQDLEATGVGSLISSWGAVFPIEIIHRGLAPANRFAEASRDWRQHTPRRLPPPFLAAALTPVLLPNTPVENIEAV